MFKKALKPLLIISIAFLALILAIGLPKKRLSSKNFTKNTISFPSEVSRINNLSPTDKNNTSIAINVPANYPNPILFIGDKLENLEIKIHAASEFNKYVGKINKGLSSSDKKVFSTNIKNDLDTFILNTKGELFIKFGNKKPQYLAEFSPYYFKNPSFKSFETNAKTFGKLSVSKKNLDLDLIKFQELQLEANRITVLFAKNRSVAGALSRSNTRTAALEYYQIATEVNTLPPTPLHRSSQLYSSNSSSSDNSSSSSSVAACPPYATCSELHSGAVAVSCSASEAGTEIPASCKDAVTTSYTCKEVDGRWEVVPDVRNCPPGYECAAYSLPQCRLASSSSQSSSSMSQVIIDFDNSSSSDSSSSAPFNDDGSIDV